MARLNFFLPEKDPRVELTAEFASPRTLVFAALAQPEHLGRWFLPSPTGGLGDRARLLSQRAPERLEREASWRQVVRQPGASASYLVDAETGDRLERPPTRPVSVEDHRLRIVETLVEREGITTLTQTIHFPSLAVRAAWNQSAEKDSVVLSMSMLAEYLRTFAPEVPRA